MAEFGLIKSFDIDDGQLSDLSPQECFVLGYELAEIDGLLKKPQAIYKPVHSENRERLEKACADIGRQCKLTWTDVDPSESWMMFHVPALKAG